MQVSGCCGLRVLVRLHSSCRLGLQLSHLGWELTHVAVGRLQRVHT